MAEHILPIDAPLWDALCSGLVKFAILKNDRYYQTGDILIYRKLSQFGGYETRPDNRAGSYWDLKFKLGFMIQGGLNLGIVTGYSGFQLETAERAPAWVDSTALDITKQHFGEDYFDKSTVNVSQTIARIQVAIAEGIKIGLDCDR